MRARIRNVCSRRWSVVLAIIVLSACSPGLQTGSTDGPRRAGPGEPVSGGGAAACAFVPPPLGVTVTASLSVTSVVPAFAAARAGIQPGDVLVEIDGQPVDSVGIARQALDRAAARRAGPCRDSFGTELDPRTGRVVATTTPLPAPTPGPGVQVTVRRGERLVPLGIDLRWPADAAGRPTPPAVGGGNFSL
jgi:hypothetical protein